MSKRLNIMRLKGAEMKEGDVLSLKNWNTDFPHVLFSFSWDGFLHFSILSLFSLWQWHFPVLVFTIFVSLFLPLVPFVWGINQLNTISEMHFFLNSHWKKSSASRNYVISICIFTGKKMCCFFSVLFKYSLILFVTV